jgi:hypothetical protein
MLLTSCANLSPIAITLTDLGTASKSEHSMKGLKVMRSVNITGLGPQEVVGSISLDPDPSFFNFLSTNWMETKDFPDSLSLRLSPKCSHIVETTFLNVTPGAALIEGSKSELKTESGNLSPVTANDVAIIRNGIQELVEMVSTKVSLEMKKVVLINTANILEDTTNDHGKLLEDLSKYYPESNFSDKSAVDKELEKTSKQLETIDLSIKSRREALKSALEKPGIIVTRWTKEEKRKGAIDAVKAIAFDSSRSRQQEGFLVLGHPRVTTLVLGNDALDAINGEKECEQCPDLKTFFKAERTYVTYYQLSAQYVSWGEVRSGVNNKIMQVDVSKIISTVQPYLKGLNAAKFTALLEDLQIKAQLELSQAFDYGNSGFMSTGNTRIFSTRYGDEKALIAEQKRAKGYQPIYSARGTLESVLSKRKETKPTLPNNDVNNNQLECSSQFEKDLLD